MSDAVHTCAVCGGADCFYDETPAGGAWLCFTCWQASQAPQADPEDANAVFSTVGRRRSCLPGCTLPLLAIFLAGVIAFYAPGVMEDVYAQRLAWGQVQPCPECVGYAATLDAANIGRRLWLCQGTNCEGPLLVVDCGTATDRPRHLATGLLAEVDYRTALRWAMRGPVAGLLRWTAPRNMPQ